VGHADGPAPKSTEKAGVMLGVSASSIQKAKTVAEAAPALFAQIHRGEMSVDAAYRQVQRAEAPPLLPEDAAAPSPELARFLRLLDDAESRGLLAFLPHRVGDAFAASRAPVWLIDAAIAAAERFALDWGAWRSVHPTVPQMDALGADESEDDADG
jgi:hypothetical protein